MNTAIDFIVYFGLTRLFAFWSQQLVLAAIMGFVFANTNSYFLNKRWTFRNDRSDHHVLATKFFIVTGSSFLIYSGLFWFLVHRGFYDAYVKVGLVVFSLVWNFVFSKLWVYTKA